MRLAHARRRMPRSLAVITMAAAAMVFAAGPALADANVTLNPAQVGATATGFGSHATDCGNAANQDGWHFIAPANVNFTSLHLEFNNGALVFDLGPGDFGPPDDSHAFVSTPIGATLTAGTGTTDSATPQGTFNLSHTCPGTPPTSQPPTSPPPTSPPPTSGPPTSPPPTSPPPTTSSPPTSAPPTSQPPTSGPPTSAPPGSTPPDGGAPPGESGDGLPDTGGSALPILFGFGIALLAGGAAVAIAARRRSNPTE